MWLEETAVEAGRSKWRGHITHIPSRQRHYFDDLEDMKQFVKRYLESMDSYIQNSDK
jgi:hypothetical protein